MRIAIWTLTVFLASFACLATTRRARAGELLVGAATVDITPPKPTALCGQLHTRIVRKVHSPLSATALALECREGDQVVDQAVMVSIDTATIRMNPFVFRRPNRDLSRFL